MNTDDLYPCVGICLPDEDEVYCIGCGRPWGAPQPAADAVPPGLTFPSKPDDEPAEPA